MGSRMVFCTFYALFYPLSALPPWGQVISKMIPMSYVFEGLRVYLTHGSFPMYNLGMSVILSCVYLAGAVTFFIYMFNQSRVDGLARLEAE